MQWCCAEPECSSSRGLQLHTFFPVPIWDLHKQPIAPLGSPIYCTEMPCAGFQPQFPLASVLHLYLITACNSLLKEFCQIFCCLLNCRWNLSFFELWPTLKAHFCLKIFALLLQLTARLLKLEINRRSKFPLFSVSLLGICDNTFTQIHCFPSKPNCKVNFLLSVEFL